MYRKLERERERERGEREDKNERTKTRKQLKTKKSNGFFSIFISDLKLIGYLYKYIYV